MTRRSTGSEKQAKARGGKAATPKRGAAPTLRRRTSSAVGKEDEFTRLRRERDEALERETANSEILRLISKSPGDLELVFRTILEDATRICDAKFGTLFRFDGKMFNFAADVGSTPEFVEFERRRGPFQPTPGSHLERVMRTKRVSHTADYAAEGVASPPVTLGGARSTVDVPMLKDNELIGVLSIYRQEVRPFTDKQIELLQNFARQAVIAIENTRLLNELRQSLEQQMATADVLRVISSSPGELQPVFEAMLENATRLCEAEFGVLNLYENGALRMGAMHNVPSAFAEFLQSRPAGYQPMPNSLLARVMRTRQVCSSADTAVENVGGRARALGGARSIVCVPMLKDDALIGTITIYRQEVLPFSDKQIGLVRNFAAQAVIAIENARLLNELRESLDRQTATSEVLSVISSSPGELQPVFQAMLENAVRICEAKFGSLFLYDGASFHTAALQNAPEAYRDYQRQRGSFVPPLGTLLDCVMRTKQVSHTADAATDPDTVSSAPARLGGARSMITVPMLKDNELIGAINIFRQEVRPFTDKQIALLTNFADQAVIAIENTRLLNELRESLEQQTATANVLRVISASSGELERVFEAMLQNAVQICDAKFGNIYRWDDNALHLIATHNTPPAFAKFHKDSPIRPSPKAPSGRMVATKTVTHIADVAADQAYTERDPSAVAAVELGGIRTLLTVPMLNENELIGAITIYRQEVRPFTDKQIALVKNFADQAVIAIENTRLLNELRQRTADLTESLEQQTATSKVLSVISSSPGDLQPVFASMLENAVRICDAKFGNIYRWEDDALHLVASHNTPPAFAQARRRSPFHNMQSAVISRLLATKAAVHIVDAAAMPGYIDRSDHAAIEAVELGGVRTALAVPMLRENELIGSFTVYRQKVRPFTDKQIELVKNFAAQAVIAIENTRLLNELRQRTTDLTESLEQQTATSEVLRVISSSPSELTPVFESMLANATRLCEANFGTLNLYKDGTFPVAAMHGVPAAYAEFRRLNPQFRVVDRHPLGLVAATGQVQQILDMQLEPLYLEKDPSFVAMVERAGARTLFLVPLLKDNDVIGVITIFRQEVQPFTDKQIALVQNFAAQAVIAIENARLLNELRQSLEQQTATAEVLRVISSSQGELEPVFQAMLENATRICEAKIGMLYLREGDGHRCVALHGAPPAFVEERRLHPVIYPGPTGLFGRAVATKRTGQIADLRDEADYAAASGGTGAQAAKLGGARSAVVVPMVREDESVGAIVIYRQEVRPFSDKQVELLTNFAAQAVIAIENTRLLNELRQSLQQQTATADVLKVISRSTFDLRTVLQTLVESAARFCNADKTTIIREKDGLFYTAEACGYSREFLDYIRNTPIKAERGSASGRALVEGRVVHVADVRADPEYTFVEAPRLGDFRTILSVPMLREGAPIGVLTLTRSEVQPFTDKQIELVTTFADQAAIAIENVRLFDEIQDKSRQLEEASQHKSQFLANMSHELRTPLNAILGYAELMADGAYGEPSDKMLGILKRLEANGKHLLGLINDVLDLSKIEAGQLVLELSDYCVQDIAQTVRSTLEPLASDKKLAFKLELAPDLPPGHGDGRRLTQVLINLVGNAIKFTDAGEVAIKAEANNGSFHVSVRDTGPGISDADQARLFQEFQQADNAITKKKGGTGLGLAISKRIIEMHGGRIWVESQPGQGSTFTFTLPVIVERQVEPTA